VTVDVGDGSVTAISDQTGAFVLKGLVAGDDIRLRFHVNGYIDDEQLLTTDAKKLESDIGAFKLVKGVWSGRRPAPFPGWVLEGRMPRSTVVAVMPDGVAQRQGIVPGAVVISVNDQDATSLGPYGVMFLASSVGESTTPPRVRLRLPGGQEREIQLVKPASG
jgi:hypothetical protein